MLIKNQLLLNGKISYKWTGDFVDIFELHCFLTTCNVLLIPVIS